MSSGILETPGRCVEPSSWFLDKQEVIITLYDYMNHMEKKKNHEKKKGNQRTNNHGQLLKIHFY